MPNRVRPIQWIYPLILLILGLATFTGRQLITTAQSSKPQPLQINNTCTLIPGTNGNTKITAFGPGLDPTIKSALTKNTNDPVKISVSLNCNSISSIKGKKPNNNGASGTPQSTAGKGQNNDDDNENAASGTPQSTTGKGQNNDDND